MNFFHGKYWDYRNMSLTSILYIFLVHSVKFLLKNIKKYSRKIWQISLLASDVFDAVTFCGNHCAIYMVHLKQKTN